MSLNALGLGFMFTATDLASGVMQNIKTNFQGLEDAAGRNVAGLDRMVAGLGAGLAATAAGIGGLAASFNAAKGAGDLEYALARVQNKAHGTKEELAQLKYFALNSAKAFGVGPLDAAAGMDELAQGGLKVSEILRRLPAVLKFAKVGEMDVAEAANLSGQAMNAFAIKSGRFSEALDQMQGSADAFMMGTKDLSIGLARIIPGATLFKSATLTHALTLFGLVNDVLQSKTQSATGLSYMFKELSDPKKIAALHQMGVEVDNGRGSFRNIEDVLADLLPKVEELSELGQASKFSKLFGGDALKAVTALSKKLKAGYTDQANVVHYGTDALLKALDETRKRHGTLNLASDALLETFNGSIDKLIASAKSLATKLGEPFMKVWQPVIDRAIGSLDNFSVALEKLNPETLQMIAYALTAGAAFLTLIGTLGLMRSVAPLFIKGAELLSSAVLKMGKDAFLSAFKLKPLSLVLLGISAIIYAINGNLGGLGDSWDRLSAKFGDSEGTFGTLGSSIGVVWDALKAGWNWSMTNFAGWFHLIGGWIEGLVASFDDLAHALHFEGAGALFVGILKVIGGVIGAVAVAMAALIGLAAGFAAILVDAVAYSIDYAKGLFEGFMDIIHEGIALWDRFLGFLGKAPEHALHAAYGDQSPTKPEPVAPRSKPAVLIGPASFDAGMLSEMPPGDIDENALLGKYRSKPAGAAGEQASGYFGGVIPSQSEVIDYDKLALACAKTPVNAYLDGQKMNEWFTRRYEDARNRSSNPR